MTQARRIDSRREHKPAKIFVFGQQYPVIGHCEIQQFVVD
jgi:hypothetical protein